MRFDPEQSSNESEKSVTVIMANTTKLIQMLTVNHVEQMEEKDTAVGTIKNK